jgi:hypothetical protein
MPVSSVKAAAMAITAQGWRVQILTIDMIRELNIAFLSGRAVVEV